MSFYGFLSYRKKTVKLQGSLQLRFRKNYKLFIPNPCSYSSLRKIFSKNSQTFQTAYEFAAAPSLQYLQRFSAFVHQRTLILPLEFSNAISRRAEDILPR